MFNELNTIEDLMTRLELHADQSAKRRKSLFVDPFEVDDMNDGIEKLIIFRIRKSEARIRIFNVGKDANESETTRSD